MLIKLNADPEDILRIRLKEAEPEQRRRLKLNRGSWVPILLAVLALGLTAFLLLWPGSPVCHVLDRCGTAAEDVWTIEITPSEQDVSTEGLLSEMLTISVLDGKGNARADELLIISTEGSGILEPQGTNAGVVHNQKLTLRTRDDGARIRYTSAKSGDTISVVLEERQERREYIVPDAPTPPPTPTPPVEPPTPTPLPPALSLNIDATVDGQLSETARPDQQLNYMVRVDNSGPGEALNVILRCVPPNGADLVTFGALEQIAGELIRQGMRIPPGEYLSTSLAFTVRSDAPEDTTFVLDCTVTHGETSIQNSSPDIRLEKPEPIRIVLLPESLDIGVNGNAQLTIQVVRGTAGEPVVDRELSIQAEPPELLASPVDPVRTDISGEAKVTLQASGEVGSGQVTVQLVESGETGAVVLTVLPTVIVPVGTNIRSEPSAVSSILDVAVRDKPFTITGQSQDTTWWQMQLPDNALGWVLKTGSGVRTNGGVANVPVSSPTPAPTVSATTADRGLQSLDGSGLVFFYRQGSKDDTILTLPALGKSVPVVGATDEGFVPVRVVFWIQQEFVSDTGTGLAQIQPPGTSRNVCWEAPDTNSAILPDLCGEILILSTPLDVESSLADVTNGWRKVAVTAWIDEVNLQ